MASGSHDLWRHRYLQLWCPHWVPRASLPPVNRLGRFSCWTPYAPGKSQRCGPALRLPRPPDILYPSHLVLLNTSLCAERLAYPHEVILVNPIATHTLLEPV